MMMDIASQSMSSNALDVKTAMNIGLTKKTMEDTEALATDLLDKMMPAPSPYGFDTYA